MYPQPVLIIGTYDENGVPNAMNAAWGITTDYKEIIISLLEHKTTDNLAAEKLYMVYCGDGERNIALGICENIIYNNDNRVAQSFALGTRSRLLSRPFYFIRR